MTDINPISRRELISKLKTFGFDGPFRATKHQYMIKGTQKIFIPNPHGSKDIGKPLLRKIIRQLGIDSNAFQKL